MTAVRWIVLAGVLASTSAVAEPPCKPSAQVTGERTVVRAIEEVLRARGIDVQVAAGDDTAFVAACRRVTAEISIGDEGRLVVAVTDADGRRTRRAAEDTEAAATVIESWARADLLDPLFATRGSIEVDSLATRGGPSSTIEAHPRFLVAGGGDVGISNDGALWAGVRVHACGMVGRYCVGGLLRYATDTERTGDTATLGTKRTALAFTLTGERPIRRGRFSLSPGVGMGLTSVTATRPAEGEYEQASAVHARAGLAAAFAFADAWSLRIDLDGELSPFARTRLGENDGVDRQLAASPKLLTWFGIAVTYGGL
jgi:hypothetical protein